MISSGIRACSKPVAMLWLLSVGACLSAAPSDDKLTNAVQILQLPAKRASTGVPVSIKGVVTAAQTNWNGRFFIQDASGGVFVENLGLTQPVPGDVVEVNGVTRSGGYAPCITKPHWTKVGVAPLPEAKPVTVDQLMSGAEDSQRIEITGVIRNAWLSEEGPAVELTSGGYRLRAILQSPWGTNLQSLVGAEVLVKGTAASAYNAPLRHITAVTLYVPQFTGFIVEKPGPADPFDTPKARLNNIAQYRFDNSPATEIHVKGVVTYQRTGDDLFLQDDNSGLQVKCRLTNIFAAGEVVEAVGFPSVKNYLPVLEDASVRATSDPRAKPQPRSVTVADLQKGFHHADFVTVQGRLIDRLVTGIGRTATAPVIQTTLVLQNSNFIFVAEKETVDQNSFLTAIPIGSLVEVSGICLLDPGEDGKINSLHILLPASHYVTIIQKPGWLTPRHLLISLAAVFLVLVVAISWSVMVSKRNSILKSLVREKETAQHELQEAHDQLEVRVKERTAQLKVEMTARKESEVQFRAVLTERTRLAQELHDTLEQTMTGIALQLDLVANNFQKSPGQSSHHLKLARNLMRQSQTDVRQSVWGLRSRAAEQFNLVNAINVNSRQIASDAGIQIKIETSGEILPLSEIIEENLLRICQEAITNVVKHAGAHAVNLNLNFELQKVVLQIKDDGKGFTPETCVGPKDGHFGLLGIRERVERMGGQVEITSAPDAGTTIRAEIPVVALIAKNNGEPPAAPVSLIHEEGT
ncbi:MAG TPA: histidine kinase [Candidatus Sulfotelmatobacter sp.]|nr:histidine kinase [Candidatus Sulfotelmatobacter sp.]